MSIQSTKDFFDTMAHLYKDSILSALHNGTFGKAHTGGYPYILTEREGKNYPIIYSDRHIRVSEKKIRPAFDVHNGKQLAAIVTTKGRKALAQEFQLANLVTDIKHYTQNIALCRAHATPDVIMLTEWGGCTIDKYIREGAPINWQHQIHIAREVAAGLYYLFVKGYLYADLTLEHVMLKRYPPSGLDVKIGDHGSIRSIGSIIKNHYELGTWGYHAPEHDPVLNGNCGEWQPPAIAFTFSVFFLMLGKSTIYQLINNLHNTYDEEGRLSVLNSCMWRAAFLVAVETQIQQAISGRKDGQKLKMLLQRGLWPDPKTRSNLEQIFDELQCIVA